MTLLRTLGLVILLLLVSISVQAQEKPCQSCTVVSNALTAYNKLHSGMTRAELEQQFQPGGAKFSTRPGLRF
jgi:hypothetical protein